MIGNVFYFIGFFVFLMSLSNTINYFKFFKVKNWITKYQKITQKDPKRSDYRSISDYNIYIAFSSFSVFIFIWLLIGIASSSWIVFLILIAFRYILNSFVYLIKLNFIEKYFGFIYNFVITIVVFLLIINHYHYHLNLLKFI